MNKEDKIISLKEEKFTAEQNEAVNFDKGNILVTASAGSGKTHVMIERAIRLIAEKDKDKKAKVNEILAVTFTEASAKEMKERLKGGLYEKIGEGREDLAEEFNDVATADICTLHSFCSQIIRKYFFAVGISPDYEIADETDAKALKKESIDKTFKFFYDKKEDWFKIFADRMRKSRSDNCLKKTIIDLYDYCDAEESIEKFLDKTLEFCSKDSKEIVLIYQDYVFKQLIRERKILKELLNTFTQINEQTGINYCNQMLADIALMLDKGIYAVKNLYPYNCSYTFRGLDEEGIALKKCATACRDRIKDLISTVNDNIVSEEVDKIALTNAKLHTESLVKIINKFTEVYSESKLKENLLDFGDLEHYALKILTDDKIRREITSKYKYVFVDEYQDVNGVQEKIINLVSNNNLFMVGDVKQSIYGFRGCRPEFFIEKEQKMKEKGEKTVSLNNNFRSAPQVINAVNQVFAYSMKKENFGIDYLTECMLIPSNKYPIEYGGRVNFHLYEKDKVNVREKETPRIYDIIKESAVDIEDEASKCSKIVANIISMELLNTYYDIKEKEEAKRVKRINYSDIVILLRNKDNKYVRSIVDGLIRQGIPVSSGVEQNLCDYPEIQTLIYALKLLECFYEDIPLVSVMKSPIGNFTEEELASIVAYYNENKGKVIEKGTFKNAVMFALDSGDFYLFNKLNGFKKYIDELRFLADFLGAGGILKKIIEDCDYYSYLLSSTNGREKAKRVESLIDFTSKGDKVFSISQFIKRVESCSDALLVAGGFGENSVKIMTIHSSKGLEFPVVIMCGLDRTFNSQSEREEILTDREFGLAVKYYDDKNRTALETPLRAILKEKLKEEKVKEELRLFYVALTRAKYSLHIVAENKETKGDSAIFTANKFLDFVPQEVINAFKAQEDGEDIYSNRKERREVLVGEKDINAINIIEKNLGYNYKYLADTTLPLKTSVTSTLNLAQKDYRTKYIYLGEKTGVERGVIAHKIMENLDFSSTNNLKEQVEKMIASGVLLKKEAEEVDIDRLQSALNSNIFNTLKDKVIYREKSFITLIPANKVLKENTSEKVVVQGVIDLLAVGKDCAVVFDYKYSTLQKDAIKDKYAHQLDLYEYAVKNILKVENVKKVIVNIFSGEVIQLD